MTCIVNLTKPKKTLLTCIFQVETSTIKLEKIKIQMQTHILSDQ